MLPVLVSFSWLLSAVLPLERQEPGTCILVGSHRAPAELRVYDQPKGPPRDPRPPRNPNQPDLRPDQDERVLLFMGVIHPVAEVEIFSPSGEITWDWRPDERPTTGPSRSEVKWKKGGRSSCRDLKRRKVP